MIVSIHQPNYAPYMGYFEKISKSDVFVLLDTVPYTKNGFINRNLVKTRGGVQWLTVPVVSKNVLKTPIKDVAIYNGENWRRKHLNIIQQSYKGSAKYKMLLNSIYCREWGSLCELNAYIIGELCKVQGIDTTIIRASEMDVNGAKSELILGICRAVGADVYYSGASGKNYLNETRFKEEGINIIYQNFKQAPYPQLFEPFIPNLSILDYIFNAKGII